MSAGYSGTPLPRKLGIKPESRVLLLDAPAGFELEGVDVIRRAQGLADVILSFHTERRELERRMPVLRDHMQQNARLWIAWPKRASKQPTDLTEDVVRELAIAEPAGGQQGGRDRRDLERLAARDPRQGPATLSRMELPEDQRLVTSRPRRTSIPPTEPRPPRCSRSRCSTRSCAS